MRVMTEERALREAERGRRTQAEMWPIGIVVEGGRSRPVFLTAAAEPGFAALTRSPQGAPELAGAQPKPEPSAEAGGNAVVAFVDDAGRSALNDLRGFSTGTPAIVAHVVGGHVAGLGTDAGDAGTDHRAARDTAPATVVLERAATELAAASVTIRHPEFGRVDIRVQVSERNVAMRVRASSAAVRAISAARANLEDSLSKQGFSLHRLDLGDAEALKRPTSAPLSASHHHLNLEV